MKKTISVILSFVLVIIFTTTSLAIATIPVKSIKLNSGSIKLTVGKTYVLKATISPVNATNKALKFASADKSIATVNEKGLIQAIKAGKTVVTVTTSSNNKVVEKCNVNISEAERVKLMVMVPELKTDTAIKQGFIAENPNVDIQYIDADNTKLMSMIAANNSPDVISLAAFHTGVMWAARGLLLSLDSFIAKSTRIKKDDFTDIQKLFQWDGKNIGKGPTYGIVKDWSLDTQLWINKKVFADAGLALPDTTKPMTFTQLADYSKKIVKTENGKQVRWGFAGGLTMEQMIMFQLGQMGKSLYGNDYKANLNNAEVKKILKYWVDLSKAGGCTSPLNAVPDGNGVSSFLEDKVGIAMWGYWYSAFIKGNENAKTRLDNFVFMQSPVMDNATNPGNSCIAGVGGTISAKTKHPEESWKFIEYYYGGPSADERAKSGWGIPMLKSKIAMMPYQLPFEKQVRDMNDAALKNVLTLKTNPYANPGAVLAIIEKYYNQVLFDKMTLDDAVAKMDEDFNIMIAEGKEIVGAE